MEVKVLLTPEVNADELNLPAEVARKLKGKRVTIVEVREGFLLKPVEDPIREARGILKGKGFNVEKYLRSKQLEKELET
ncbi:MAG TPA: hypothetical protein GXX30_10755 [Firmicutes bacterium]|nr:hypothetical protein [Candidatus Fermentithermobacillaceae bacterium]